MKYDNVGDARTKLVGTLCYYKDRAVTVREIVSKFKDEEETILEQYVRIYFIEGPQTKYFTVSIDDPDFKYMQFNIGYINHNGYAVWYYRIPSRQYRQGLHRSQCHIRDESKLVIPGTVDLLGPNAATAAMLENRYPSFEEAITKLDSINQSKIAFHKNFAVFKDRLRNDYVIEFKGRPAAYSDIAKIFKCSEDMKFLSESIQELNIKVA